MDPINTNMKEKPVVQADHAVSLCSKINEYQWGDVYCDIDIRVQGKSFKCHRLVLGAASSYFHTMFTSKFKESTEFVVTLEEIAADTFEGVLQFIYTGNVSINPAHLYGLFNASEHYTLPGLQTACVKYIEENPSVSLVENLSQLYSLFRATSKKEVLKLLDERIFDHFESFSQSSEFLKISIDDLTRILKKLESYAPSNHDVFHKAIMRWTVYAVSYSPEEKRKFSEQLLENIGFNKLSAPYMEYMTKWCIKHTGNTALSSTDDMQSEAEKNLEQRQQYLHAFAVDEDGARGFHVFSGYRLYDGLKWIHTYSSPENCLPDFMRTVKVNNVLYCLTNYTEPKQGTTKMQEFITSSSISLFPQSYLASPPLLLKNFDMCKIHGNIYVYNKDAQSQVDRNAENSENFDDEKLSRAVYLYNTETDLWLPVPPPKKKFANACMTSDERMLYLIGGTNSNHYVQGYDPRTPGWIALTSTSGVYEKAAACCDSFNELYVSGGCQNPKKVEMYNPKAAKWRNETNMREELYDHEMVLDKFDGWCTYKKYLAPNTKNVFFTNGEWSSCMYDDLEQFEYYKLRVIHMTLFKPYGL